MLVHPVVVIVVVANLFVGNVSEGTSASTAIGGVGTSRSTYSRFLHVRRSLETHTLGAGAVVASSAAAIGRTTGTVQILYHRIDVSPDHRILILMVISTICQSRGFGCTIMEHSIVFPGKCLFSLTRKMKMCCCCACCVVLLCLFLFILFDWNLCFQVVVCDLT
jgi:hypothetical protein